MNLQTQSINAVNASLQRFEFKLSRGVMRLDVSRALRPVEDMLRMAERLNPKRAFLFVSSVLGRHIPVRAGAHRSILNDLADLAAPVIDTDMDVLVMGYAETAVGLGAGLHDALRAHMGAGRIGYLPTTRHPGEDAVWFEFSEDHSHATAHHVLVPTEPEMSDLTKTAQTLVLVDDEVTTGATFLNLLMAASAAGKNFKDIVLVTLTDWSNSEIVEKIRIAVPGNPNVSVCSLISGRCQWDPLAGIAPVAVPSMANLLYGASIDATAAGWRRGITGPTPSCVADLRAHVRADWNLGRGALVIGTGELVWQPMRLAEDLEQLGIFASFLATTRSPVLLGGAIESKVSFSDHYGLGLPMYLHNVNPEEWGVIILMVESDDLSCIDPRLARHLQNFYVRLASGRVVYLTNGNF